MATIGTILKWSHICLEKWIFLKTLGGGGGEEFFLCLSAVG